MKKIVVTESQVEKLMDKMISEQVMANGKYRQEVTCSFEYHNLTYKGGDIDWIPDRIINVSFDIDMEARSFGIKDISVYNVKGPEAVEAEIIYYPEGTEESIEEEVALNIDWSTAVVDRDADISWIGLDGNAEIQLTNNEEGGLIIENIVLHSSSF